MTKEELLELLFELLESSHIYVALHNCDYGDASDFFIIRLKITNINRHGIFVEPNDYDVGRVPFEGYKEYWSLTKEDLQ